MSTKVNISTLQFELSQSVTASGETKFTTGETVEVSFLTKGSSQNGAFTNQNLDLFYAADKESPSWTRFTNYPKAFYSPSTTNYVTRSFVAGVPTPIEAVKMVITGSVHSTASYNVSLSDDGNYPEVKLNYDNIAVKIHTPKTEITDEGVLIWNSPNKYIKADSDGIEIKGGAAEVETLIADTIQVYGDVTAFGQMVTTNLEPYTDNPTNIGTTSTPGAAAETKYAKGDHQHDLPFSILNSVAQEGEFTNISGSVYSTGSFGRVQLPDSGKITLGTGRDLQIYHNGTNSYIHDAGYGNLKILASNLDIQDKDGANYITAVDNSGVTIYHNGNQKFQTQVGGVEIQGHITASNLAAGNNISASGTIVGSNLSGTNTGDVTLAGTRDYITISNQVITRNEIDIMDDTNLSVSDTSGQTGINMTFTSDNISGVVSGLTTTSDVQFASVTASNITSSKTGSISHIDVDKILIGGAPVSDSVVNIRQNAAVPITSDRQDNGDHIVLKRSGTTRGTIHTSAASGHEFELYSVGDLILNKTDGDNVGIGKLSPTKKLEVEGDISASTTIYANTFDGKDVTTTLADKVIDRLTAGKIVNDRLANSTITIAGSSTALGTSISANTIAGQIGNDQISGDQINGGTIDSTTITHLSSSNITASANISASGDILSDGTGSFKYIEVVGDISASGTITADNFVSTGADDIIDFGDSLSITGNISASGDISGSGTGSFGHLIVKTDSAGSSGSSLSVAVGGAANNTLTIKDVDTKIGHPNISSTGTLFLQGGGGATQIGGDLLPTATRDGDDLGSLTREFSKLYVVSSSVSRSLVNENLEVGQTGSFGRIGIGTSNPIAPLNIAHASNTSGTTTGTTLLSLTHYVGSGSAAEEEADSSGDLRAQKTFIDFNLKDGNSNSTPQVRVGAEVGIDDMNASNLGEEGAGAFVVYTNSGSSTNNDTTYLLERMRVNHIGNVGIGTSSPTETLHVEGSKVRVKMGSDSLDMQPLASEFADHPYFEIKDFSGSRAAYFGGGVSGSYTHLYTAQGTNLVLASAGANVGIGTIAPTKALQVNGDISASGDLYVTDIQFTGTTNYIKDKDGDNRISLTSGGDTIFYDHDGTAAFYIDTTSPRVGVGTATPDKELQVAGEISSSGDVYVGGNHLRFTGTNNHIDASTAGTIKITSQGTETATFTGTASTLRNPNITDTISLSGTQIVDASRNLNNINNITATGNISASNKSGVHTLGGNVGIGVTDPDRPLEVVSGNDNIAKFYSTDDIAIVEVRDNDTTTHIVAKDSYMSLGGTGGLNANNLNINTSDGKVGIGTTSPDNLLHLREAGNSNAQLYIYATGSAGNENAAGIKFNASNNYSQVGFIKIDDNGFQFGTTDNEDIKFFTDDNVESLRLKHASNQSADVHFHPASVTLFVSQSGAVGINTTSPGNSLPIGFNSSTPKLLEIKSETTSVDSGLLLRRSDNATGLDLWSDSHNGKVFIDSLHNDDASEMHFRTRTYSSGDADSAITILGSGNVGIGDTGPAEKLVVDGKILTDDSVMTPKVQAAGSTGLYLTDDSGTTTSGIFVQDGGNVGINIITPSEKLDVNGNIKTHGNISSPTFESGFAGSGFRITSGSDGKTSFAVDDLTVRGSMSVFELLIHQIRATNGSLFVSNTGKLNSASLDDGDKKYTLFFDTGSQYGHSFVVGDLIRAQRFKPDANGSGSQIFKSDLHVISTNTTQSLVAVLSGSDTPEIGYDYVRIGNTSNADRQGSVYLTADDANAPFIDVVDNISSHSHWNTSGRVKVRMGKLDGITTSTFGTLDKYGFYASGSAYLEGSINATSGKIAEFSIDSSSISSSNDNLKLFSDGVISGSDVFFDGGQVGGFTIDTSEIKSNNASGETGLRLKAGGQITGSNVLIGGDSEIAGWNVTDNSLSKGSVTIASSTQLIRLGGVTDFTNDDSAKKGILMGLDSSDYEFFVGQEDTQFMHWDGTQLRISSSNFSLENGNITASNVDLSGVISASEGNIGGFTTNATEIKSNNASGDTGLRLKASGQITASDAKITGDITATSGQFSGDVIATHINTDSGSIGGFIIGSNLISSSTGTLILKDNGQLSGSAVSMSGTIVAESGRLGGWDISGNDIVGNNITLDAASSRIYKTDSNDELTGYYMDFTPGNNYYVRFGTNFAVSSSGQLIASGARIEGVLTSSAGKIANWNINTNTLSSTNGTGVTLDSSTPSIYLGGKSSFTDNTDGVWIGTDGISIGDADEFNVTNVGVLSATGATISGSLYSTDANISGILSASTGNIGGFTTDANEIKSNDGSKLRLKASGEITASSAFIEGTISASAGNIGGFTTNTTEIKSNDGSKLRLKASGQITASEAKITGDIVANTITANTSGQIGGFDIGSNIISASSGNLILKSSGQITASAVSMSGTIETDDIEATGGHIGGWNIVSDDLSAGQGDEYIQLVPDTPKIRLGAKGSIADSNTGVHIGSDGLALGANSVFKVTHEGVLTATEATITGDITATSGVFSGSISASAGTIGNWDIGSTLSSGTDFVLDPNTGGRITMNNKTTAWSSTLGIYIGSASVNNIADEYVIALGDTSTNDGGFFASTGTGADYVYLGEFGQANSTNDDVSDMSGSFISYKSSNQSIAISSKHFKMDETGDIQISSSGDSAQILLDVDTHKQQGIELNSDKGIFGYGDKDGKSKELETHGGMFKFTAAPISIEGGLGGQGWPTDDTSNEPPTTFGNSSNEEASPGGGYEGT